MATCDPDGRIAQMVGDMHACLVMDLNESIREARDRLAAELALAAEEG